MNALEARRIRKRIVPYLLILPASGLVAIFIYGVVNGVLQGFGYLPFLGKHELTVDFYAQAFARSDFLASTGYSLYISAVSSVVALVGGVALSAALTRIGASRRLQLFDIQIPIMTAHVIVVLFIVSLFSGSGLFPRLLYACGLTETANSFTSVVGEPSGWGIILAYVWKEVPFIAFCTIAIMSHVSQRFGEAALTLGASPMKTFLTVTLPLCKSAIVKAFLVVFAFTFGSYEVPFLLGPTLPKALPVLAYFEFQNPDILNRGYAMAISGVMVLICSVIALIYFLILYRDRKG